VYRLGAGRGCLSKVGRDKEKSGASRGSRTSLLKEEESDTSAGSPRRRGKRKRIRGGNPGRQPTCQFYSSGFRGGEQRRGT